MLLKIFFSNFPDRHDQIHDAAREHSRPEPGGAPATGNGRDETARLPGPTGLGDWAAEADGGERGNRLTNKEEIMLSTYE